MMVPPAPKKVSNKGITSSVRTMVFPQQPPPIHNEGQQDLVLSEIRRGHVWPLCTSSLQGIGHQSQERRLLHIEPQRPATPLEGLGFQPVPQELGDVGRPPHSVWQGHPCARRGRRHVRAIASSIGVATSANKSNPFGPYVDSGDPIIEHTNGAIDITWFKDPR